MARMEVTTTECDLCPRPTPASGREFCGTNGTRYEVDLCEKHGARLESLLDHQYRVLAPFVKAARERKPAKPATWPRRNETQRKRMAAIRAQAIADGHLLEPRGRLPVSIVREYAGRVS